MDKPISLLNAKAQALTELAVFGSIILILLGVLLNYGLRYNYQQQIQQRAFQDAYKGAKISGDGQPLSRQYMLVQDVHIPDPQNPFAVGGLTPVVASAGVTRSLTLGFPESSEEVPHLFININGNIISYALAGRRTQRNVSSDQDKKYHLIYGTGNLDHDKTTDKCTWQAPFWDPIYMHHACVDGVITLKILDNCDGDIINYGSAFSRCREITDYSACLKTCGDDPSLTACPSICSQTIEVPWYCQTGMAALNRLFDVNSGGKPTVSLGMQQGFQDETTTDNTLTKTETPGSISTTDTFNWKTLRRRGLIIRSGTSGDKINLETSSEIYQDKSSSWSATH